MTLEHLQAIPNLAPGTSGPLRELETKMLEHQGDIERWFRERWRETQPPFYASVDLRNAGYKLAPVDTNLFPAGFNNLGSSAEALSIQALQSVLERVCPTANGVLLVPESHTRNKHYLHSVWRLTDLLTKSGYRVKVGSLALEAGRSVELETAGGKTLVLDPVTRTGDRVVVGDFNPCAVLLNNDLSGGRPELLEGLEQPVLPPLGVGWTNRLKSQHFEFYSTVADEFAQLLGLDPWLFAPLHRNCGQVDFMRREGEDCLAKNTEALLEAIREKYAEYGIEQEPFVAVKADAGTYGMGVMMARSADDVRQLNRKQRTRMAASKEGRAVTGAIIQEGVYTQETWGDERAAAEPVVYMIDRFVVGGFYRVHTGRGASDNLNAPGMEFKPLPFAEDCNRPDPGRAPDSGSNRFYTYGVIARLALVAAARETARHGDR